MTAPTLAQQRGLAIAPIPFAASSFLSSSYVIYYLLWKERQKLKRLYHRLVLAMNVALLPLSFTYIWSSFAIPEGTPNYYGASGTIQTCTAQGFIKMMFSITVPTYYGSLSLQAFMAMKKSYNEAKYVWIERWIHLIAWCIPCAIASVVAATDNFNPSGSGCWLSKAPRGCEDDPTVECERGEDIGYFVYLVVLSQIFLYLIFPPSVILAIYCWIKKIQKKAQGCRGMQRVRQSARKELMKSIAIQISVYLLSFWFTWVFALIHAGYQILSGGQLLYNLNILSNCMHASQGFVFTCVYFTLQRLGKPKKVECATLSTGQPARPGKKRELTVKDIRASVLRKSSMESEGQELADNGSERRESLVFNIFDGVPDADSPWAKFIDQSYDDDCCNVENGDTQQEKVEEPMANDDAIKTT